MTELFADTSFFISFLNPADGHHRLATDYMDGLDDRIVTTQLVLVELANYLSGTPARNLFTPFLKELAADARFEVLPADQKLIDGGILQYERAKDKKWSFTDCASFVVMRRRKIREALTADDHFRQAGFSILLS